MAKKKSIITEFKEFISRGSVIDLAVGVVMGSAFTAIVTSLVNDIIMPVIGLIFGGIDFSGLKFTAGSGAELCYGNFIQSIVNFILISLVIFLIIKIINKFYHKKEEEPAAPPAPSEDVVLLKEIRDLLKENSEKK